MELRELMNVYLQNLLYAKDFQKRVHDKGVKPWSYAPDKKVWLNSKYIKTKRNQKLEAKFIGLFRMLYPIGTHAYKLQLPAKWKIYDVLYLSMLEQDTTRKEWMDKFAEVPSLNLSRARKKNTK